MSPPPRRRPASFVALVGVLLLALAVPVAAQDFAPLTGIAAKPPSGRVLFFPLDDDFAASSPYALVPATGRRIAWTPESTDLPVVAAPEPVWRAIGSPPAQPERARYLVPVLDAASATLAFAPRQLAGGRLVPFEGAPAPGLDVVPVLAGPRLDATPSMTPLERILGAPVEADVSELTEVTPALLVRKVTPSRVVFGVRLGADAYLPLVDEDGLAATARRDGKRGLAVPLRAGVTVGNLPDDEPADDASWPTIAAVVAGASVAVGGLGLLAWRRGARQR